MRFISVDLSNIGVYRGTHTFDLRPVESADGVRQNMVVVYGRNGAGKSTLYRCMRLALYGKLALGDRVPQQQYQDQMARYLHDRSSTNGASVKNGYVSVQFEYAHSGRIIDVRVRRSWRLVAGSLKEDLRVLLDGREPDLLDDEYRERATQDLIYDFLPLELSDVCFFDAEQLDSLSSPETHNSTLGDVLRRFLGLDIVVRLQDDIQRYIDDYMRSKCGSREALALRDEILGTQDQLETLRSRQEVQTIRRRELAEEKRNAETALKRLERQLASQGGTYAEKRRKLQEQLNKLESDREHSMAALAELCGELLPFSFVPELLSELRESLQREEQQHRGQLAEDALRERQEYLSGQVKSDSFWDGIGLPDEAKDALSSRFMDVLNSLSTAKDGQDFPAIHHITDVDRQRIPEWIRMALTDVPRRAVMLSNRCGSLEDEISRTRTEIDRAPEDSVLAPLHNDISDVRKSLDAISAEESAIQDESAMLKYRISEAERELRSMRDRLVKAQSAEYNLDLANRSRLVLKTYEDALIRSKIQRIEDSIAQNFNALCHKSSLLSFVRIDPADLSVALYGNNGNPIVLSELSAGERQLYVVSLLWALRQVSRKDLPLVVDTPIAKLDEGHGWQLIHEYFPKVSSQVVLFAHTKEMDNGLLDEAVPYTARRYRLDYHDECGQTSAECEDNLEMAGDGMHAAISSME